MNSSEINWELIKNNPYEYAKKSSQILLEETILEANKNYYNTISLLKDNQYDILYSFISGYRLIYL